MDPAGARVRQGGSPLKIFERLDFLQTMLSAPK